MSTQMNFGGGLQELGRIAAQELIRTDYGPGSSFNGIGGHGLSTHGATHTPHEQVNLYQPGVKDSGLTLRFLSP